MSSSGHCGSVECDVIDFGDRALVRMLRFNLETLKYPIIELNVNYRHSTNISILIIYDVNEKI